MQVRVPTRCAIAALLLLAAVPLAAQVDLGRLPVMPLPAAKDDLKMEPVGIAGLSAWVSKTDIFRLPDTESWQQLLVKKDSRAARRFTITVLDLESGALRDLTELAGYGIAKFRWSNGLMCFGTWLPGGFYTYDPRTGKVAAHGQPFDSPDTGPYSMSVSPDGVVSMGAGGVAEVSVFDPKTGAITRFKRLSEKHNFVYEIGSDNDYLYAALRGRAPWELVAVNKKTGERKTLFTAPLEGYINASGSHAVATENFSDKNSARREYDFKKGEAILRPAGYTPPVAPPSAPPPVAPQVLIDDSPLLDGKKEVAVWYQTPNDRSKWQSVSMPVPVGSEGALALTAMPDGRIAALSGPYNPAVVFDPVTGQGIQAPFGDLSGRCMVAVGPVVYASGYPSTTLVRWDTSAPVTNRLDLPGRVAVPADSPESNPRRIGTWRMGPNSGGHMGVRIFKGPDGVLFICTARHRYARGYDVVWYDPAADARGEIEDGGLNDHLSIAWASALEGGSKIIIATTVEPNDQLKSPIPDSGKLIIVDLPAKKYVGAVTPLPGMKALTGIAEVAPGKVVGLALAEDKASTFVYRYDLAQARIEQVVRYSGLVFGEHGTTQLPGKGADFVLGPDGRIWTGANTAAEMSSVLLIDPVSLGISAAGKVNESCFRFAFLKGEVYVNGGPRIRRLPQLASFFKAPAAVSQP